MAFVSFSYETYSTIIAIREKPLVLKNDEFKIFSGENCKNVSTCMKMASKSKKKEKKEKWYKKLIQLKIVTKYVDLKNKNRPFFQTYEWKND